MGGWFVLKCLHVSFFDACGWFNLCLRVPQHVCVWGGAVLFIYDHAAVCVCVCARHVMPSYLQLAHASLPHS